MKIMLTGGAGFIGSNLAARLIKLGHKVVVVDNLSRVGSKANLDWLKNLGLRYFEKYDVRNWDDLYQLVKQHKSFDVVIHEAGQVAVTTSVIMPRDDFEVNALGTFNLLELIRKYMPEAIFIYASTNKVYGKLNGTKISEINGHYSFNKLSNGINENFPLDFYSPYGCSKGAADQYVRDYFRIYGLKTIVLRQSCIYGQRQFGIEDQGWVAWFIIAALLGKPISIYGNGKQVRDVLHIDDLIDVYLAAVQNANSVKGEVFNIGGGVHAKMSLLDLVYMIEEKIGKKLNIQFSDWRPGDQPIYISDIRKARMQLGWEPKIDINNGIDSIFKWVIENLDIIKSVIKK